MDAPKTPGPLGCLPAELLLKIARHLRDREQSADTGHSCMTSCFNLTNQGLKNLALVSRTIRRDTQEVRFQTVRLFYSKLRWSTGLLNTILVNDLCHTVKTLECDFVPDQVLAMLPRLKTLSLDLSKMRNLDCNRIAQSIPTASLTVENLRFRDDCYSLRSTGVIGVFLKACKALKGLETNIHFGPESKVGPENLEALKTHRETLEALILTDNGYGGSLVGALRDFTALKKLQIHQNSLLDVIYDPSLAGLTRIITHSRIIDDDDDSDEKEERIFHGPFPEYPFSGEPIQIKPVRVKPVQVMPRLEDITIFTNRRQIHDSFIGLSDALPHSIEDLTIYLNAPGRTNFDSQLRALLTDAHHFPKLGCVRLHYPPEECGINAGDATDVVWDYMLDVVKAPCTHGNGQLLQRAATTGKTCEMLCVKWKKRDKDSGDSEDDGLCSRCGSRQRWMTVGRAA